MNLIKQIFEYIDGRYDIETFFQKALFATRQLAKRQITWFRHQLNEDFLIESLDDKETVFDCLDKIANFLKKT